MYDWSKGLSSLNASFHYFCIGLSSNASHAESSHSLTISPISFAFSRSRECLLLRLRSSCCWWFAVACIWVTQTLYITSSRTSDHSQVVWLAIILLCRTLGNALFCNSCYFQSLDTFHRPQEKLAGKATFLFKRFRSYFATLKHRVCVGKRHQLHCRYETEYTFVDFEM